MAGTMIDYSKVISQADQIGGLSDTLSREIGTLENLLASIKSGWCGPASDMYQKQMQLLLTDLQNARQQMADISESIKETAQRLQTP